MFGTTLRTLSLYGVGLGMCLIPAHSLLAQNASIRQATFQKQNLFVPPAPEPSLLLAQADVEAAAAVETVEVKRHDFDGWAMTVTPQVPAKKREVNVEDYDRVYNAIPYRRHEYLANPSYRHDTTIEILFGQMRPTVVHRNDTPQRVVNKRPKFTSPYLMSRGEIFSDPRYRSWLYPYGGSRFSNRYRQPFTFASPFLPLAP